MALFHDENATDPDDTYPRYVDVTLGISFIFMFLISLIMNPLSFLYHSRKKTLPCALYTYLAICDFVVNLWHPLAVAQYLLQGARPTDHIATINERCAFLIYFTFSSYSGLLVNIILLSGAVMMSRPGSTIPKGPVLRLVCALLGLYTLLHFLVAFSPDPIGAPFWAAWSLAIHYRNSLEVVVWVTYVIFFIPGPFAIAAAMQYVTQTTVPRGGVSKAETLKIIMLCIPNMVYPLFLTIDFMSWHRNNGGGVESTVNKDASVMSFFGKTFLPIFSSTWNSVFICLLTKEMRVLIHDLWNKPNKREALEEHDIL